MEPEKSDERTESKKYFLSIILGLHAIGGDGDDERGSGGEAADGGDATEPAGIGWAVFLEMQAGDVGGIRGTDADAAAYRDFRRETVGRDGDRGADRGTEGRDGLGARVNHDLSPRSGRAGCSRRAGRSRDSLRSPCAGRADRSL